MTEAVWSDSNLLPVSHDAARSGMLHVDTISDYPSFLLLKATWNRLVDEAGIDHPFLRHEWIRTWWEAFGRGRHLNILVVKAGTEVIAIAPLMLSSARIHGVKVKRLGSIANDHSPRFDFIVARDPGEVYPAIWRSLLAPGARWDVLQLSQVPGNSWILGALPRLAAQEGFLVGRSRSLDSPWVPFHGRWEHYFAGLSRNHRAKVRKGLNRLRRLGKVELEVVSSGDELVGALDTGLSIEAAAWKGEAGVAIRSRSDVHEFYERLAQRTAQTGLLRLVFLTLDQSRIAFAYALAYGKKLYVLKAGYDPRYARYSPYNVLCYLLFQHAAESGVAEYEFLGDNDEWKRKWTNHTKPHYCILVFPPSRRARLLYAVKFQLIPVFQRYRLYRVLRDAVPEYATRLHRASQRWLGTRARRRSSRRPLRPAPFSPAEP